MIKIHVFLSSPYSKEGDAEEPWITTSVEALPRVGDDFQMESGKLHKVESIRFVPQKNGSSEIHVWIKNLDFPMTQLSQ